MATSCSVRAPPRSAGSGSSARLCCLLFLAFPVVVFVGGLGESSPRLLARAGSFPRQEYCWCACSRPAWSP